MRDLKHKLLSGNNDVNFRERVTIIIVKIVIEVNKFIHRMDHQN